MTVGELAVTIMNYLSATPTRPSLESDLLDLCGYEWVADITTIMLHRQQLVKSYLISFFYF